MVEENKVEIPKMRFVLDEGRWGSKTAVEIMKDAIVADKNWKMIWERTDQLIKENEDGYWALREALEQVQAAGDFLLDHENEGTANQEDFDQMIHGLEDWEAHKWLRILHETEFIQFSTDFMEKCRRE